MLPGAHLPAGRLRPSQGHHWSQAAQRAGFWKCRLMVFETIDSMRTRRSDRLLHSSCLIKVIIHAILLQRLKLHFSSRDYYAMT